MRERGYTFVSITIAISVATLLMITFVSGASKDSRIDMLDRTHLVVSRLNSAVSLYYDARCKAGAVTAPTITDLVDDHLIESVDLLSLPAGGEWSEISILNSGTPRARFKYTVKFLSSGDAEVAAGGKLNTNVVGHFATWIMQSHSTNLKSLSEGDEYLRAFRESTSNGCN